MAKDLRNTDLNNPGSSWSSNSDDRRSKAESNLNSTLQMFSDINALSDDFKDRMQDIMADLFTSSDDKLKKLLQRNAELSLKYATNNDELKAAREAEIARRNHKIEMDLAVKLLNTTDKAERERLKEQAKQQKKNALKTINDKYADDKAQYEKNAKIRARIEKDEIKKQRVDEYNELVKTYGKFSKEAREAKKDIYTDSSTGKYDALDRFKDGLVSATEKLSKFADGLSSTIRSIGDRQSKIDTALQGSRNATFMGSYWQNMSAKATQIVGLSPFLKQENYVNNMESLASSGIAFNIEQRAFLQTISEKIAATFNASDDTLRQLIRIQQEDTTAARLGMESSLTAFLNNMYETSEYMRAQADQVRASLQEAQKLMGGKSATEFEYQVQKWLGSLYSLGFSQTSSLANVINGLASGQIDSITGGGTGNLAVMASNRAGLSLSSVLKDGLDSSETNQLMKAMVEYMSDLYNQSKDNLVVQQQIAKIYGLSASDLKAAANLNSKGSLRTVASTNLSYSGMIDRLNTMANTMYQRTSIGEMTSNLFDNFKYTMAAGVANNPITYGTWAIADLLKDTTGGIKLPMVMGTGTDTTVADLMRVGAMAGGIISGIAQIATGLGKGSAGGFSGSGMLSALGIGNNSTVVSRGSGNTAISVSGASYSESGFVGNASGSDVYQKTLTDANDSNKATLAQAQEEETAETTNKTINESILNIYNLLLDVVSGNKTLHVENGVMGTGLTIGGTGAM